MTGMPHLGTTLLGWGGWKVVMWRRGEDSIEVFHLRMKVGLGIGR